MENPSQDAESEPRQSATLARLGAPQQWFSLEISHYCCNTSDYKIRAFVPSRTTARCETPLQDIALCVCCERTLQIPPSPNLDPRVDLSFPRRSSSATRTSAHTFCPLPSYLLRLSSNPSAKTALSSGEGRRPQKHQLIPSVPSSYITSDSLSTHPHINFDCQ